MDLSDLIPRQQRHQVDDRDQVAEQLDTDPGGTPAELALMRDAPSFPAAWPAATIPRREPLYEPAVSLEMDYPDAEQLDESHVEPDPTDPANPTIQVPRRKLIVLAHHRVAAQSASDAGGVATIDLTPGYSIPSNQSWLIDRIVGRCGAQGQALVYAGAPLNDQDLLAQAVAQAGSFAWQTDGNAVELRQGWRLTVAVLGGGNALVQTAVAYYRLAQWVAGGEASV